MKTSLTTKFNLLTIAVMLMTAITIGSLALYCEVTSTRDELVHRGMITAGILAQASEYGVYTENVETLKVIVNSARMDPDFAYVVIHNANNNPLIQEAKDRVSNDAMENAVQSGPLSTGATFSEVLDHQSGRRHIDIHVAIESRANSNLFADELHSHPSERVIGHLRLGLSEERLSAELYGILLRDRLPDICRRIGRCHGDLASDPSVHSSRSRPRRSNWTDCRGRLSAICDGDKQG